MLLATAVAVAAARSQDASLCKLQKFGGRPSGWGSWTLYVRDSAGRSMISPESVIFSVGISSDATFDLAIMRQTGATVVGFDPTISVEQFWEAVRVASAYPRAGGNLTADEKRRLSFQPFGLGTSDTVLPFYLIKSRDMYTTDPSALPGQVDAAPSLRAPLLTLQTLMYVTCLSRVTCLKVDIEGAEYDLFADGRFLRFLARHPPEQIAMEQHDAHRSKSRGNRKFVASRPESGITRMSRSGRLFGGVRTTSNATEAIISKLRECCGYELRLLLPYEGVMLFVRASSPATSTALPAAAGAAAGFGACSNMRRA